MCPKEGKAPALGLGDENRGRSAQLRAGPGRFCVPRLIIAIDAFWPHSFVSGHVIGDTFFSP